MLKRMLSWLGEKSGEGEAVPPAVAPSFEPLEARLLLNADLSSIGPVPAYEATPVNQAVYVDLDGQDEGQQAVELFNVSPALFVENQGQW